MCDDWQSIYNKGQLAPFFLKRFLISLLAALVLPTEVNAAKINCNSPVWKNKPQCKNESVRKKVKTILNIRL